MHPRCAAGIALRSRGFAEVIFQLALRSPFNQGESDRAAA